MAIAYNPKIVTSGLTFYLDAGNPRSYPGSGTTWNDVSGSQLIATLVNGPTYSSANLGSIVFDNVNDVITVPYSSRLLSNNGTLMFWARPLSDGTSGAARFALMGNDTIGAGGYNIAINTDRLFLRINGGLLSGVQDMANYYNKWSLYTFSWNSSNQGSIYINTTLDITGPLGATVSMTTTNTLYIGNTNVLNRTFDGNISLVQYYNRQLSFAEIQQNFNAMRGRYNV
jgi:hypothetical protein